MKTFEEWWRSTIYEFHLGWIAEAAWRACAAEHEAELAAARELIKQQDDELAEALKYSTELLAAARELGPCGHHPLACYGILPGNPPDVFKECLACDREKAAVAAALEEAAKAADKIKRGLGAGGHGAGMYVEIQIGQPICDAMSDAIEELITTFDASALQRHTDAAVETRLKEKSK